MKKNFIMASLTILSSAIFSRGGHIAAKAAEPIIDAQTVSTDQDRENERDTPAVNATTDLTIKDIQNFSYQFFAQNLDSENPVLSPVSAYLALSMAGLGAEGTTQEEFMNILGT